MQSKNKAVMEKKTVDDLDISILSILQKNARTANADIARQLRTAPSVILDRIRKLHQREIIQEFTTRLDARALDFGLVAYVFLKTNEKQERWNVGEIVARIPEVLEVHDISGEDCYLVKLRTRNTDSLFTLLREKFAAIPSIASTRTTIVLRTVKETTKIPLETSQPAPKAKKKK